MLDETRYCARRTIPAICLIYFIIGVSQFFGTAYVSLYVKSYDFVDNLALGFIMALNYIVAAAGQIFWGNLADKSYTKNKILIIVLSGTFTASWFLILPNHTTLFKLIFSVVVLNIFLLMPLSLYDAIVVENTERYRIIFGSVRCFSSGGSAVVAFVMFGLASIITVTARTGLTVMAIAALCSTLPMYFLPPTRGHAYGHKRKRRLKDITVLLKNRRFILVLFFGLFNFTCTGAYVAYYCIFFISPEGLGSTLSLLNLYSAIAIGCEAVLIIVCSKVFRKKNIYWIFIWVSIMGLSRSLAAYLAPNPYILMAFGIFQGLMFGPLWGRVAPYIGSIVQDEVRATAQATWSVVTQGMGPAVGAVIGGVVTTAIGLRNLFLVISCMHLIVMLLFSVLFQIQYKIDKKEGFETEVVA